MMERMEWNDVPENTRKSWGAGPWQSEPDKAQWTDEATGLVCLAVRNMDAGFWCGYVGVPPAHSAFGCRYTELDDEIEVHGRLSFSDRCHDRVCHIRGPDDPEVWWLGFDCAHAGDSYPGREEMLSVFTSFTDALQGIDTGSGGYRDLAYVQAQCAELARQLAAMSRQLVLR